MREYGGKYRRLRGDRYQRSVEGRVLYLQFTHHVMCDVLVRDSCIQIANHESEIANPRRP
jgi:hypothetical protein